MKALGQPFAAGRTAEIYDWEEGAVLKLYRDWCPPEWIDQEARIAALVQRAGISAPAVGDIVSVDGRRGLVYERVDGPSMLDMLPKQPFRLAQYAGVLARLHLDMHRCSGGDLSSQRGRYAWSIEHAPRLPEDLRRAALERLASLPEGDRLCHGDYHPGNVLLSQKGPVVIDWMTASKGSPAADVARTYMLLTLGDPPPGRLLRLMILLFRGLLVRGYLGTYKRAAPEIVEQARAWLPVVAAARLMEDIPPEREKLLRLVEVSLTKAVF